MRRLWIAAVVAFTATGISVLPSAAAVSGLPRARGSAQSSCAGGGKARTCARLFTDPRGIALDSKGDVYVADTAKNAVLKLSPTGRLLATFRGARAGADRLDAPVRVTIDPRGDIYVAERQLPQSGTGEIVKLSARGRPLAHWAFSNVYGFAVDAQDDMYLTDYLNNVVEKVSPSGQVLATWHGADQVTFSGPEGLAVDAQGNIYVSDTDNERIVKLSPDGQSLAAWGTFGEHPGQFEVPLGVAVDAQGNVYVADSGNSRIEKFSSTGQFLAQWGTEGTGRGQFYAPFDIAINSAGDIYVTDPIPLNGAHGDNRLQEFSPAGKVIRVWK